jgi:hypothetical protein
MTYDEFQKLHPDVVKRLSTLKLKTGSQSRSEIEHNKKDQKDYRTDRKKALYYKAVIAEREHLMDFTPQKPEPKPKPAPKPKPIPEPIVSHEETIPSSLSNITNVLFDDQEFTTTTSKSRVDIDGKDES